MKHSHRCRLPAGHPEGYLEAMGNLYSDFADSDPAKGNRGLQRVYRGLKPGLRGMAFIETVAASQHSNKNG